MKSLPENYKPKNAKEYKQYNQKIQDLFKQISAIDNEDQLHNFLTQEGLTVDDLLNDKKNYIIHTPLLSTQLNFSVCDIIHAGLLASREKNIHFLQQYFHDMKIEQKIGNEHVLYLVDNFSILEKDEYDNHFYRKWSMNMLNTIKNVFFTSKKDDKQIIDLFCNTYTFGMYSTLEKSKTNNLHHIYCFNEEHLKILHAFQFNLKNENRLYFYDKMVSNIKILLNKNDYSKKSLFQHDSCLNNFINILNIQPESDIHHPVFINHYLQHTDKLKRYLNIYDVDTIKNALGMGIFTLLVKEAEKETEAETYNLSRYSIYSLLEILAENKYLISLEEQERQNINYCITFHKSAFNFEILNKLCLQYNYVYPFYSDKKEKTYYKKFSDNTDMEQGILYLNEALCHYNKTELQHIFWNSFFIQNEKMTDLISNSIDKETMFDTYLDFSHANFKSNYDQKALRRAENFLMSWLYQDTKMFAEHIFYKRPEYDLNNLNLFFLRREIEPLLIEVEKEALLTIVSQSGIKNKPQNRL